MRKAILVLGMIVFLGGLLAWQGAAIPQLTEQTPAGIPEASKQQVLATYGKLPLSFEANQGQSDEHVKFLSRGRGYSLFLTSTEAVLSLISPQDAPSAQEDIPTSSSVALAFSAVSPPKQESAVLRMGLVGANPEPEVAGLEELPGKSNYFIGNDSEKWRANVPHYAKVKYKGVYPGIDLVYYGTSQQQLEYDFVVAPGADPKAITLNFEGADNLEVDAQGDLLLHFEDGDLRFRKPYVYQEEHGIRHEIVGGYLLKGKNEVTFEVTSYEVSHSLIIDPVLEYSTYLGGSSNENNLPSFGAIAVDSSGNAYVTGQTFSTDFPTAGTPFQAAPNSIFVTKLNADGSALIYSTYLGGSGLERVPTIALDHDGNAYVTGQTGSSNFPTVNPFQSNLVGSLSAFVTKLNADGSALVYSTYLGGSDFDQGGGIAVDAAGNAYVAGGTRSLDFPITPGAFQAVHGGGLPIGRGSDFFVTKFNADGSALVYSTYLGGSGNEFGTAISIAVDASGNAYLTGQIDFFSTDFPTANAFQPAFAGGVFDAFVTKLNADGSALIYSTYLGGSGDDKGGGIGVDAAGNAYVTGETRSLDFPITPGAFQAVFGGSFSDAFVTKLNADGSALVYSTYLGGSSFDSAFFGGIAVDAAGHAYVVGETPSIDFPTTEGAFQDALAGPRDAFVTKLNADGSALIYSTYLGGSGDERGGGIAVDAAGSAYVVGETLSIDFPTTDGAFQNAPPGPRDAFVAKIGTAVIEVISIDIKPGTDPNAINPADSGLTPVAVLTTDTFDATTVSPITVQFGPAGASPEHQLGHLKDADGDGDLDLVLHFPTQDTGIQCGDTEASLTGETFDGQAIQGSDSIVTVGCN